MRRPVRPGSRRPLALCGLALAAACASGPAATDAYFRIEAGPPPAAATRLDGVLEVERFRTDPLTGQRPILFRKEEAPIQVRRHKYRHWVDSPTAMLQRELARYLRAAGAATDVVTPEQRARADYVVIGRIERLERIVGDSPRVVVELDLAVSRERGTSPLLHERYREELPAAGDGVGDAVAAFDRAVTAIFERFLADLGRA